MEGLISIIVPVYNVEKYLSRCLDSLVVQTYRKLEIILVNDGSTDDSGKICDRYAIMDKRIKVIHKPNGGVSSARNVALDIATGDYIAFVDADDWLESDWAEIAVDHLKQADADCYIGSFVRSYDDGRPDKITHPLTNAMDLTPIDCLKEMYLKPIVEASYDWCVWGKLFRAVFWQSVRFDKNVAMEEDGLAFWQILSQCSKIIYRPDYGYHYLDRDDSAVNSMKLSYYRDSLLVNKYFAKTVGNFGDKEITQAIYRRYLMSRLSALIMLSWRFEYADELKSEKEWLGTQGIKMLLSVWKAARLKGVLKWLLAMLPHNVLVPISRWISKKKGIVTLNTIDN